MYGAEKSQNVPNPIEMVADDEGKAYALSK